MGGRPGAGLPPVPKDIFLAPSGRRFDWPRISVVALGLVVLALFALLPSAPDAVDPSGRRFALTHSGQTTIGLALFAALWWSFEVIPLGVTSLAIGVLQVLLHIRAPKSALGDFLDPAVWFIFGSLAVGMAFSRAGLTQRLLYPVLALLGERTRLIYLSAFATTAILALVMAHTAAAAAVFPLLMAIYPLYDDSRRPTRFGKGLFIGMAMSAGAASVVTLLGSARAVVGAGIFEGVSGREIPFFELSYYLLPLGWTLVLAIWLLMLVLHPPEKDSIPGLRDRLLAIRRKLGPVKKEETITLVVVVVMLLGLSLASVAPALAPHKSAVVAGATVLLFLGGVLGIEDLEALPWNIVLLFGGAMSLGACMWQTGAAHWLGVHVALFIGPAHWLAFVLGLSLVVLLLTNFVVNVAVLAFLLPVALVVGPYVGSSPEVVLYATLAAAGLPLLLLIGAAPNAMAFESRQFTPGEFLRAGLPATALVMLVIAAHVLWIWPLLGMSVRH